MTPSAGISSTTLAEIVAHEFGHTLGFGHSTDSTALMYASVTGVGPSLRADDQVAARWLYPSGTVDAASAADHGAGRADGARPHRRPARRSTCSGTTTPRTRPAIASTSPSATARSIGCRPISPPAAAARRSPASPPARIVSTSPRSTAPASRRHRIPPASRSPPRSTASFVVTPSAGVAGVTNFVCTDTSTGATSWSWNFGDGGTSTLQNPTHVYSSAGHVHDPAHARTAASRSRRAPSRSRSGIAADFTFAPSNPTTQHEHHLHRPLLGQRRVVALELRRRHVVDAAESGEALHLGRQLPGDADGVDGGRPARRSTRTPSPSRRPRPPRRRCPPRSTLRRRRRRCAANVAFTDRSTGSPTSWQWSFGDGSISTAQNPTHAYAFAGFVQRVADRRQRDVVVDDLARRSPSSAPTAYRSLVPAAAQTNGVGGSVWRTELTLFNGGSEAGQRPVHLHPRRRRARAHAQPLPRRQSVDHVRERAQRSLRPLHRRRRDRHRSVERDVDAGHPRHQPHVHHRLGRNVRPVGAERQQRRSARRRCC